MKKAAAIGSEASGGVGRSAGIEKLSYYDLSVAGLRDYPEVERRSGADPIPPRSEAQSGGPQTAL